MECSVTVSPDALNTRSLAPPANVTRQLPSGCGDLVDRVYRFQEDWVTEVYFRDPQRTQHVHPPVTLRLFKCSCVNICVVLQRITVFLFFSYNDFHITMLCLNQVIAKTGL